MDTQTIKLDQVLDPTLAAAIIQMDSVEIRKAYDQYGLRFGATPEDCLDSTLDQLSVLKQVVSGNRAPYADFARGGPWWKRLLRKLSRLAFTLLPNGLWQKTVLDGQPTVEVWMDCWQVFRVAMLRLEAGDTEILDLYASNIRTRASRYWRECWFMVHTADHRTRAERWEKLKKEADRAHAADPINSKFDPCRPGTSILHQSRGDADFWSRNVREPAAVSLARARPARDGLDVGTNHPERPSPTQSTEPARKLSRPSLSEHQPRDAIAHSSGDLAEKDGSGKFMVNKKGGGGKGKSWGKKRKWCDGGTTERSTATPKFTETGTSKKVLYLYSGAAENRVTVKRVRASFGFECDTVYSRYGPGQDRADDTGWSELGARIEAGEYFFRLASFPCSSSSAGRYNPNRMAGPDPLRACWPQKHMWGLPHLWGKDKEHVRLGNLHALRAAKAASIQIRSGRGVAWENPQPWRQGQTRFYLEPLTELLALGAKDADWAQCPFGAASAKSTRIRYFRGTFAKVGLQLCRHPDRVWWDADSGRSYWKPHAKLA
jgi:hypothetical protein